MNKVILMGRLTRDPETRYSEKDGLAITRFTLAVDRKTKKQEADFIQCVVFGKTAEFTYKYFKKGMKAAICGRIQTGSYTNREGNKVYTTEVVCDEVEFAESKQSAATSGETPENKPPKQPETDADGFMNIPEGIDEELPFD